MKITDEMIQIAIRAIEDNPTGDDIRTVLEAVAPLITAQHERDLLEHAWSGQARGAIRGAIAMLAGAQGDGGAS